MRSLVLLSLGLPWLAAGKPTTPKTQVILPCGAVVNGVIDPKYPSVPQYLGIPFAQPPVGPLRWEPPLRNNFDPKSIFNATKFGQSCTQFEYPLPTVTNQDVLELDIRNKDTGEDCLTLSVWTPSQKSKLPVLVFFYGGGWYTGGQDVPYQNPTQWIERTKDLIVVVPNSRGNIFGYPNAEGATNQNLGMLDQRMALEWIRDNIAAFGGDSSKITIWGQSSGAEQVDFYNFAWRDDPIVHGLIMNSGTGFIEDGSGPKTSNFSYVASQVGCGSSMDAKTELACMKKVDASIIEKVIENSTVAGPPLAFGPSGDDVIVPTNMTKWLEEGKVTKIPTIIGIDQNEGISFAPYNASGPTPDDLAQSEFWFQNLFLCPSYKTTRLRAAADIPTYRYLYRGNFSNVSPRPWLGAYHGSEIPMLFGTHGNYRGASTKNQIAVSKAMQDAYRSFAFDPLKGLQSSKQQHWKPWTEKGDIVRVFGDNGKILEDKKGALREWDKNCA